MKKKQWVRFASRNAAPALGILVLATMGGPVSARTGGSPQLPAHFGGVLSDYTPSAVNGTPINGGPYEMHGKWMLDLNPARSEATFSAAIAMETSEVVNTDPNFDPGTLGAHTHHISVTGGVVHNGPMDWQTMCPAVSSVTGGFVVTGSAYVTANGANPPFGNPSPVTICVLGVSNSLIPGSAYVQLSNFTLTIGAPASAHFGPQAIHGVVSRCGNLGGGERQDCKVTVVP
ncbi:MAG TPA: hypothetical protein VFK31_08005 [Rhodanobacteraceae bacterium]|nr:hypothetical protein [Rhodanobacteraceae bacterium]